MGLNRKVVDIIIFLIICIVVHTNSQSSECCLSVDVDTRQIVDKEGRARLFHGVNVVYKRFPFHPENASFDSELSLCDEDIQFLSENGFNVVRLYVAWPGVEPQKDHYNNTYLDVLSDFVNKLGSAGIYTILDCHQDIFSPKFCGEGVPDYAALYFNRTIKPLPFPELFPQLTPFKTDPKTGYPSRDECNQHQFFTYYFSDAVGKAWQSLYDNEQDIQERFTLFWSKVSKHFADNPHVLGYELLNEPWAGDIYRHIDQVEPHIADKKNLQPMYLKLFNAMNQFDKKHIIFFEPTLIFTSLPLRKFSSTGFTEGPGGSQYRSRQAFSYHMYCILMDKEGQPSSTTLCDLLDKDIFDIRISDQKKLNIAGFMTEWGAYIDVVPGSKAWNDAIDLMGIADEHLQSWSYWQFKGYGDITTQSSIGEGLYFKNSSLQEDKLKILSRTYAQAVAGRYIQQKFDPVTSNFTLVFVADTSVKSPTDIFLNEKLYYPNGFHLSITPNGTATAKMSKNHIEISFTHTTRDKQEVTISIYKK